MNYVNGGPGGNTLVQLAAGNGTSNIMIIWDHANTPGCADSTHAATPANPRGPWPIPDTTSPRAHYPDQRHNGIFNVLYCDGDITGLTQNNLVALGTSLFLDQGSTSTYP